MPQNLHDRLLLDAALGLGGETTCRGLARGLARAAGGLPGCSWFGLGVRDTERGSASWYGVRLPAGEVLGPLPAEDPGAGDEKGEPLRAALDLPRGPTLRAPIELGTEHLGTLFLGVEGDDPGRERFLERLGRIAAPFLWNCFTRERFERGDRRRDALIELSSVVGTSLEPTVVLDRARHALGRIEGHRHSWIGLLDEGGESFRVYARPAAYTSDPAEEIERRPVTGSVLEGLADRAGTFVSGDLGEALRFPGDAELHAAGVRRYVAAPLRAGGRLTGALLFGSEDALQPLEVDVWLIENAALQLALAIENAQHVEEIRRRSARRAMQNVYLREEIRTEHNYAEMIGRSPALGRVFDQIERVARTDSAVLITGPTGVGKELVARAIHAKSRVAEQPMVKLNCAAIPEGTVESELFGHERGAFTSAIARRIGRFELAHEGTLFLDEVGELPLAVQAKLLRVLQDGDFERVGGVETLESNARILAATNRDLEAAIEKGEFRADLFYRLNVFPVAVPALEERREDIPLLVEAFLEPFARAAGKSFASVDPASMERLVRKEWPGNVRELKHVVERAVLLCDGPRLVIEDEPHARARAPRATDDRAGPPATLAEMEERHLRRALEYTGWVVEGPRGAAALLGLKGSTLRFRMKRLGIERPAERWEPVP